MYERLSNVLRSLRVVHGVSWGLIADFFLLDRRALQVWGSGEGWTQLREAFIGDLLDELTPLGVEDIELIFVVHGVSGRNIARLFGLRNIDSIARVLRGVDREWFEYLVCFNAVKWCRENGLVGGVTARVAEELFFNELRQRGGVYEVSGVPPSVMSDLQGIIQRG